MSLNISKPHYSILMIGNSFCYYFVEELYELANNANIELDIYNVYKGACTINEHYKSLFPDSKDSDIIKTTIPSYELWHTSKNGRVRILSGITSLEQCVSHPNINWDVITLQQHFGPKQVDSTRIDYEVTRMDFIGEIYSWLKNRFASAKYYWQETWAYEIGWESGVGKADGPQSVAERAYWQQAIRIVSDNVKTKYGIDIIPSGDIWEIARQNDWLANELHIRTSVGNDYYHDGDIGGGQYLNACIWYEKLFNKSCICNNWKPKNYYLADKKIYAIKEIVNDYYKDK